MITVPSRHTAIGDNSLEQKERYDIITDEEWHILVKVWDTYSDSDSGKYIKYNISYTVYYSVEISQTLVILNSDSQHLNTTYKYTIH